MKYKYNIKDLDCANCAKKIEETLNKDKNIKSASVNFAKQTVTVETNISDSFNYVKDIVENIEPDAILSKEEIKETKNKDIYRILLGAFLGILGIIIKAPKYLSMILILLAYIILLYRTLTTAIKQLRNKTINENFLVTISTIGAYLLGETHEGLMVIFLYEIGKMLESKAVNKSRNSVAELMNIKEETSNLKDNNKIKVVPTTEIKVGDIIVVKEGERVPLDGIVVKGETMLDTSALTGESLPVSVSTGDNVLSGSINKGGILEIKVSSIYKDSTVNKILELVENATERKTKVETIVSKYSSKYTIGVIIIAILTALFLPLFTNMTYTDSIYKGLTILVISCPCAIAISIPLSYFSGIGAASKEGILIKGSNYLDSIKDIKEIVFDKTGTITTGEFYISKINIHDKKYTEDQIMEIFAGGESLSNHPIAKSVLKNYTKEINHEDIKDYKEVSGKGIEFTYKKDKVRIGNAKFCKNKEENSNIYLMINNSIVADLEIKDEIKKDVVNTMQELKKMNINIHMFTGDTKEKATEIAQQVGIDNINYSMLPSDKYTYLEEIIKKKTEKSIVSFVGDGINDAPVLKLSDLGISMGSLGTDSAIEASDVVIMNDNLEKIVTAINISKKTNKIIKENLIFALGVKLLVLVLTLIGLSTMLEAVFADVGVTVLCILNTLRLLKK
ncbi:MAG: heavy metal translocating P-type ATPase [Bacilli bacterium]|nr:heavy metal translocating P-type ATPase [Bacilli bacterium]